MYPNLFNQNNNLQLEMQVHQAFLNTPEGKEAEQHFAAAKKKWWEKVNNPQTTKEEPNKYDSKFEEIDNKFDKILSLLEKKD